MTLAAILAFWALAGWAWLGRDGGRLVHGFFLSLPFGSFAVLPPGATGGLTLTPTPVVALLILLRCLARRGGVDALLGVALGRRRMLLLFLFWIVAALITAFMPLVMAGRVDIIPFRGEMLGATPLRPTAQNLSQFAYLSISVFVAFAFAVLLRAPDMRQCALRALCLGALATVLTGALDFASAWLPLTPLLDPFRTATYALLVTHEVLGAKRIVGLMPEASAFGSLAVSLLAMLHFGRRAIADRRLREIHAPALMALLVLAVWRSTSSTAYVALGLLGLLAALEWGWRALAARRGSRARRGLGVEFATAAAGLLTVMTLIAVAPGVFDPVVAIFDKMVVHKLTSSSFEERGLWTATSWRAMLATYGVGVGVGSSRASSSVVGVISGTGILGALIFYSFVLQTLSRRAMRGDAEGALLLRAVRWSFGPVFATGLMIGISADFGPLVAFLFGFAAAAARGPAPARLSPREPPPLAAR